jgi:hypothetical protein
MHFGAGRLLRLSGGFALSEALLLAASANAPLHHLDLPPTWRCCRPLPCLPAVCMDGMRNRGAVKGAVDEFAAAHNLTLTVTCEEMWPSWIARKP